MNHFAPLHAIFTEILLFESNINVAQQDFIKLNNNHKNYISYSRPYYKIKVGDFENKKIAAKIIKVIYEI